ncbi:DnaJ family domain-containing protein [Brevibacillus daliensis]|uniref:DnaJ family domain-containing protein n=1 Tax=Brevibacillus daliensis TaxID=2892995 RepID=UPI001E56C1E3|nr:DnaJ family domain-containing protein [Brevibacillus daliensis]
MTKERNDHSFLHKRMPSNSPDSSADVGDIKDLPGFGKPLKESYLKGDALSNVLKEANYIPSWVDLQHSIRDELKKLVDKKATAHNKKLMISEIEEINKLIAKYNRNCPPIMQRGQITYENMEQKLETYE